MKSRRFLPLLLVLFVGSGCAALIYEVVWFQLLQLVIGSTAVSMGVLLGTFMGGMCIGSLALPKYVSARRHPLRVYGALELGIGIIGIIVLFVMPYAGGAYTAIAGQGVLGVITRALLCIVCLLPPTILMGASLPAIARWIETTPDGVSWLGFFYGGNTAGAVAGSLIAGFYLLRLTDMPTATYVAAAINLAVAALAFMLATFTTHEVPSAEAPTVGVTFVRVAWPVYVVIALSGLTALGAEVVWTRLLSLLLGGTTYTFSIILAVFLIGLGVGSGAGAWLVRGKLSARVALGVCQLLLVAAVAWAAYLIARALPYWPIDPGLSSSARFTLEIDFARALFTVLPAALLWGASFPIALAAVAEPGQDPGRLVGGVYAANTIGAIVGAIAFSIFLIPGIGTQNSQRAMMIVAAGAALLMFVPLVRSSTGRIGGIAKLVGATCVALALIWTVPRIPFELIAYGRQMPWRLNEVTELYRGEGRNSSIGVSEEPGGIRNFHVSGKVEASSEPQDMRLQRMLGSIPALFNPNAKSVLVVGFGAGVTAGSVLPFPSVTSERICEIEPLIPTHIGPYFTQQNFDVLHDPRVTITYDDARHFILTTKAKYDIITSDPIHPWVKGAATLYTKEYFELVKAHLNPGGLVTQWVPLYESNEDAVKSEIATFFQVFPNGTIWGNTNQGQGYDLVLLGQVGPLKLDVDSLQAELSRPDFATVSASLGEVGFYSAVDLLSTYAGRASDLAPWLAGAQINLDRNLRLQYLAGMTPDWYKGGPIYNDILKYRRYPDDLFSGTLTATARLRTELGAAPNP
ncbi:MAG TPA: fused MFS/spermidine synthase [Gemmatimonadaceae bacterium]